MMLSPVLLATAVAIAGIIGAGAAIAAVELTGSPTASDAGAMLPSRFDAESDLGDMLLVDLHIYDQEGRLLLSTDPQRRAELEQNAWRANGPFVIPELLKRPTYTVVVPAGPQAVEQDLTVDWGHRLIGTSVGDTVGGPISGTFAGYNQTVQVDRWRGPFNRTVEAATSLVEKYGTLTNSEFVMVDDVISAKVEQLRDGVSRLTMDVHDGMVLSVRQIPLSAEVRVIDEARFGLYILPPSSDLFSLVKAKCVIASSTLGVGSYRLQSIDEERIIFDYSPTRYPQMMEKSLWLDVTVIENKGPAASVVT